MTAYDEVQDKQPQNMACCHIDYIKWKNIVECHVQQGLSDLPLK